MKHGAGTNTTRRFDLHTSEKAYVNVLLFCQGSYANSLEVHGVHDRLSVGCTMSMKVCSMM